MSKILPSRFRYPLFFLGILLMETAGVLYKLIDLGKTSAETMVIIGFLVFAFSILAT
ncbi:MAG: hypothetical protein M0Z77_09260 [Thermoplasmatales archaeon]|nr:hypothetical protein [Thermoplasmatales archaeon]